MSLLDQIGKTATTVVERARFEAEKFQRTTRLQAEVNDLQEQHETLLQELGQRAYDLFVSNQIYAPSIQELAKEIDRLRADIITKEESLKAAQQEMYPEDEHSPGRSGGYTVPWDEPAPAPNPAASTDSTPPQTESTPKRACSTCTAEIPVTARFCPKCGIRQFDQ